MKLKADTDGKIKLTTLERFLLRVDIVFGKIFLAFCQYRWRSYDPAWLVSLAQNQLPNEKWLHDALRNCTQACGDIPYIHFVNPRNANKPGAQWQFEKSITLDHPEKGDLVLDVLKNGRIGGVEFLGVLLDAS